MSEFKRQRFDRPRAEIDGKRFCKQRELGISSGDDNEVPPLSPDLSEDGFWWFEPSTYTPPPVSVCICGKPPSTLSKPAKGTIRILLNSKHDEMHTLNVLNVRPVADGPTLWNMWQFSMVYPLVYSLCITKSGPSSSTTTTLWSQEPTMHIDAFGNVLPEYWKWRKEGWALKESIICPNGPVHTEVGAHYCLWPKDPTDTEETDIIDPDGNHYRRYYNVAARSLLAREYIRHVKELPSFRKLQERIERRRLKGKLVNVELVDIRFPSADSIRTHAKGAATFIQPEHDALLFTKESMQSMLYAHQLPFSYTLILADMLANKDQPLFQ